MAAAAAGDQPWHRVPGGLPPPPYSAASMESWDLELPLPPPVVVGGEEEGGPLCNPAPWAAELPSSGSESDEAEPWRHDPYWTPEGHFPG